MVQFIAVKPKKAMQWLRQTHCVDVLKTVSEFLRTLGTTHTELNSEKWDCAEVERCDTWNKATISQQLDPLCSHHLNA